MKLAQLFFSALLMGAASFTQALEIQSYSAAALAAAEDTGQPLAYTFFSCRLVPDLPRAGQDHYRD